MNMNDMIKLAERGHEFVAYMKEFYGIERGLHRWFTEEEIVDGINDYLKNEDALKGILRYGADTVDRERVRDIILMKHTHGELVNN